MTPDEIILYIICPVIVVVGVLVLRREWKRDSPVTKQCRESQGPTAREIYKALMDRQKQDDAQRTDAVRNEDESDIPK